MNWILVKNTVQRLLTRPVTLALILAYGLYTLATVGIQAAAAQNTHSFRAPGSVM